MLAFYDAVMIAEFVGLLIALAAAIGVGFLQYWLIKNSDEHQARKRAARDAKRDAQQKPSR